MEFIEYKPDKLNVKNFFQFSINIFVQHRITELNKILNPDQKSLTLHSFTKDFFTKNKEVIKKFRQWKHKTKNIRNKIKEARNKVSSHADKDDFHKKGIFYALYEEEVQDLLEKTLSFLDILYESDKVLENTFNVEITPGSLIKEKPSRALKELRLLMIRRTTHML